MHAPIDARTLSKLRWRCRRGLLENDLFIERFFDRHAASLSERNAAALLTLMDLPDHDLLDLLLARTLLDDAPARDDVLEVLQMLRVPAARPGGMRPAPVLHLKELS